MNYQDIGYKKEGVNKTLFIKFFKIGIMIVQVDADDIIFRSIVVSIAEDEFIHDRSYCTQQLWMNQMFEGFGIFQDMFDDIL